MTYYLEKTYQKGKEVLIHVIMKEAYMHYANCDKPITKEAEVYDLLPQDISSAHTYGRRKVVVTGESCKCEWMGKLLLNGNQVSVWKMKEFWRWAGVRAAHHSTAPDS